MTAQLPAPALSVVCVTNGGASQTIRCLQSVVNTCSGIGLIEFIVIDNASHDETEAALIEVQDFVRSQRFDPPISVDSAWGEGIAMSGADHVLLVTNDIVLQEGWLLQCLEVLEADQTCSGVTPTVLFGSSSTSSQAPSQGSGVCLLMRRASFGEAVQNVRQAELAYVSIADSPVQASVSTTADRPNDEVMPSGRPRMQTPDEL